MNRVRAALALFVADVFASVPRKDQRAKGDCYLRGLMLDGRRKSMQVMASRLPDGNEQNLQQFVNQSTWDPVPVQRRVCERMLPLIGPVAWVIDDVSVPKDGRMSVLWPGSTDTVGEFGSRCLMSGCGVRTMAWFARCSGRGEVIVMSMRPRCPAGVPDRTAEVARLAFPRGCVCMRIRDALGPVFGDEECADLFPRRGQPAWPPGQLAMVSVLQFMEGLSAARPQLPCVTGSRGSTYWAWS